MLVDERGGNVFEDFAALPAWKGAGAAQAGDSVIDGLARVGAGGNRDAANEALVPWRANFEGFAFNPFLAAQQKASLRARSHLHGARFSWGTLQMMVQGRGQGEWCVELNRETERGSMRALDLRRWSFFAGTGQMKQKNAGDCFLY